MEKKIDRTLTFVFSYFTKTFTVATTGLWASPPPEVLWESFSTGYILGWLWVSSMWCVMTLLRPERRPQTPWHGPHTLQSLPWLISFQLKRLRSTPDRVTFETIQNICVWARRSSVRYLVDSDPRTQTCSAPATPILRYVGRWCEEFRESLTSGTKTEARPSVGFFRSGFIYRVQICGWC